MKTKIYLTILIFILNSCARSKVYTPPKYTQKNFERSIKSAMPNDVLDSISKFKDKEIHWIGILTGYERIFLSPKGGGEFLLDFPYKVDAELKFFSFLDSAVTREDLMFVYGKFKQVQNNLPLLQYSKGSFVHEKYYSTKIWEYDIVRDANGDVVINKRGLPVITNLIVLKIPEPGEND